MRWIAPLAVASTVLLSFYTDNAGDRAAAWWRELARWPEERREAWTERAAIIEVDGGLGRDEAERQAFALLAEKAGYHYPI